MAEILWWSKVMFENREDRDGDADDDEDNDEAEDGEEAMMAYEESDKSNSDFESDDSDDPMNVEEPPAKSARK